MLSAITMIIWGYAVARLLQVPFEYTGERPGSRGWLFVASAVGIAVVTFGFLSAIMLARTTSGMNAP